jgi:hypothetical protein
MKKIFLIGLFLAATAAASASAQNPPDISGAPPVTDNNQTPASTSAKPEQQKQQADYGRKSGNVGAGNRGIIFARRQSFPFKMPISKEQRRQLAPDAHLNSKYSDFLRQPRTGLIKLFPDAGCEENARVLRVDSDCLNWVPNSAFYSFREREHTTGFLSDIRLKNNVFVSNSFLSQGILAALGDIPLESISLASDGMKFLVDYQPAIHSREALKQFEEITKGVKAGKYEYRNVLMATENMTYAIRTIAYRAQVYQFFQGRPFNILEGDKRVDLILAFRIVRKDKNGAAHILWKELDRKDSPRIIFPKREKKKETAPANHEGLNL